MLKGQKPSQASTMNDQMQKRYLIVTSIDAEKKYHYPLPLAPVDLSDTKVLDKDTVKFMIKQMASQDDPMHFRTA
jgi:hypothetical protein